ncbi:MULTISPECIES: hypothetical protein [unclassified Stygiolobus]
MSLLRYGSIGIGIPIGYDYVYYSTFREGEYDFLSFREKTLY